MSGTTTITAVAGFFQNDTTTPDTAIDLDTAVTNANANLSAAAASAAAAAASAADSAASAALAAGSAASAAASVVTAAGAITAATNAAGSQTAAAASATAAANSATNAATSATASASSAAASAASATTANTQASTATAQAALATTQATAAAASAGAASSSATLAATNAAAIVATSNGRNRLINGRLRVQQRGAGPFTTNGQVTADGFRVSTTAGTISTTLNGVSSGYGPGVQFALTAAASLGTAGYIDYIQRIVAADASDLTGQTVTASFYCTSSTSSGALTIQIYAQTPTASNNWTSTAVTQGPFTATLVGGNRYAVTFAALPDCTNGLQFGFRAAQTTGSGSVSYMAGGFQMEAAGAASALELTPIADDFSRCLRSYYTTGFVISGYGVTSVGSSFSSSLPQPMRVAPTVTVTGVASTNVNTGASGVSSGVTAYTVIATPSTAGGFSYSGTAAFSSEV